MYRATTGQVTKVVRILHDAHGFGPTHSARNLLARISHAGGQLDVGFGAI